MYLYFVSNKESWFYQSPVFTQILQWLQNNPKKAPPQLQRQLRENDDDQQEQLNYIQQREQAKKRINERFDAELLQLQKLWAQTPPKS